MGKKIIAISTLVLTMAVLSGCGGLGKMAGPMCPEDVTIGPDRTTESSEELVALPEPAQQIVVGVYSFTDQTGQYKDGAIAGGSTLNYSRAVSQGATSVLMKALEDSGWFLVLEREGLNNLLKERELIRSTRMQYQAEGQPLPPLPPMLYAGVLLEGGIIAYDTNTMTGGFGERYFGLGANTEYRKDEVTIYLRAVAVKNGQVLKTVTASKSILSRQVAAGIYRFIKVKRLIEAEVGYSTNEPVQLCVTEAVQAAVKTLIIEGIIDGQWSLKDPQDIKSPVIQSYLEERTH